MTAPRLNAARQVAEHVQMVLSIEEHLPALGMLALEVVSRFESGGRVFCAGNGGSAAMCQHLVAELVGRFRVARRALPAFSLAADGAVLTALGNDFGQEYLFSRQIEGLCSCKDILIVMSTSGQSSNIVSAVETARGIGMYVGVLTGAAGEVLARRADWGLALSTIDTARVQEGHLLLVHLFCDILEEYLIHNER
jgi:D-sedoheptulose 7-phosphate isomerase